MKRTITLIGLLAVLTLSISCGARVKFYREYIKAPLDERPPQSAAPTLIARDVVSTPLGQPQQLPPPAAPQESQPLFQQPQQDTPAPGIPASALPIRNTPSFIRMDNHGMFPALGFFYNWKGIDLDLGVGAYDVCAGSEFRSDRPAPNDPCWMPVGDFGTVGIPPLGGRSPWLRVYTRGGQVPFSYFISNGYGYLNQYPILVPIDRWGEDNWCPGNANPDWYWEIGHTPQQNVCSPLKRQR